MKRFGARQWLNVFLVIGMLVALFLVYEHFSPSASEFCTFGEGFDCGIVNKSPYAVVDGLFYLMVIDLGWNVPLIDFTSKSVVLEFIFSNAFLGFLTLLFVMLLNTKYKSKKFLWIKEDDSLKWVRGILIFGLVYGFYLFLVQHFILKTYCIFCLGLDVSMVLAAIASWCVKK